MDAEDADPPPEARPPLLEDLVSLCRNLNREGARYVVIGGMAVIQAGFGRATNDIDLLIDASAENQDRVRRALMALPDQAVRDMAADDLDKYVVVRIADEIVVDLMASACGVTYQAAAGMIDEVEIEGVRIPFASARLLWRTKDTVRDKDKVDRAFLARLLAHGGHGVE
jgi:hypothetical protein